MTIVHTVRTTRMTGLSVTTTTAVMASAATRTPVVPVVARMAVATPTATAGVVATLVTPTTDQRRLPLVRTNRSTRQQPPSLPRLLLRLPDGLHNLLLRRLLLLLQFTTPTLSHLLSLDLLHPLLNELGGNAHGVVLRRQQQVPQLLRERSRILLQEGSQCDLDVLRIDRLHRRLCTQAHTSSKASML